MSTSMAFTLRSFLLRLAACVILVLLGTLVSRAGGPKDVAGSAVFDPSTTGQPLTWPQGVITYYTDQGDLSPILPNASANSFVAAAFVPWTSVSTAAVSATRGGSLAEDVSGANVYVNADGTITMPADIQPTATATPVGIVYDYDGAVTNALMGSGAGDPSQCYSNAVFGGNDSYGTFATYQHALIVINGQCAQQSSQLNDVKYRLMRVIGGVLGLGWSQVNSNVLTASPHPTSDDYAGFPVMHYTDPFNCTPITLCYPNPTQLAADDAAELSRLYPVTSRNLSTGKQVFSATTARIHGSVWFIDSHGYPAQAMQGVNVVARWIDPTTGLPSRRYAASSVSGFLFTGDAGNPVTGFDDSLGNPLAQWGSNSQAVEGFFDLAGLPLPTGNIAQYQLSVEALDATWSAGVGPYSPGPVAPSGQFAPLVVPVSAGGDLAQDILMAGSARPVMQAQSSWTQPAALPLDGDWVGSLSGYGDTAYLSLAAQASRTLSVAVTALDDAGNASQVKSQPVIGMWAASDPQGTAPPAYTTSPFNQTVGGMSRLDAQVAAGGNFLIGISDFRGDGRPDYHYHAHVLYADSIFPSRVGVNGGAVAVYGTGFGPGLTASVAGAAAPQLAVSAGQILLAAPVHSDGLQSISLVDPVSGSSSVMTGVLTYGAAASDNILLVGNGLNSATSVGTQAARPVTVRVVQADGVTPVSGATVGWSATNGIQLSVCGGTSSCSVPSDESGYSATWLTPSVAGVANITATLAPGVYSPAKSQTTTLYAIESTLDIGVWSPSLFVAQGASASIPLTARVLSNGAPQGSVTVNFKVTLGAGMLSAASASTNAAGKASVTLTLSQFAAETKVSACVAPANAPCQIFDITPVPAASQQLLPFSGSGQFSTGTFQPIIVRVTDSATPPDPVIGASVTFLETVLRPGGTSPVTGDGEMNPANPAMPVILQVSSSGASTDMNGLASIAPSAGTFSAPLEVDVAASASSGASLDYALELLPGMSAGSTGTTSPSVGRLPVRYRRPMDLSSSDSPQPDGPSTRPGRELE